MTDDATLLGRWRSGDAEAGNVLVRRHFAAVFRFFRNKVNEAASDLTQQTFLALAERRDALSATCGFRAYLFGVARHKLVHHLRRHYRDSGMCSTDEMSAMQALADPATSPTRRIADNERRLLVDQALRALPLDHQIVLELYYWNEMGVAEIATVVEGPAGSVKARLFRARRALERKMAELQTDELALTDAASALSGVGTESKA